MPRKGEQLSVKPVLIADERPHDGKQDRGAALPDLGVAIPLQVAAAPVAQSKELRSQWMNLCAQAPGRDSDQVGHGVQRSLALRSGIFGARLNRTQKPMPGRRELPGTLTYDLRRRMAAPGQERALSG